MTKQEIKTIVKDVINEDVNPKFEFIESIMSRQYGMFKEQFITEFHTVIEYVDSKNGTTNSRIDELDTKQKRNFDLLCVHDRKLEALEK